MCVFVCVCVCVCVCVYYTYSGILEGGSTESYLPSVEATKTTISHPYRLKDCYAAAGSPVPFTRKVGDNTTPTHTYTRTHMQIRVMFWLGSKEPYVFA